MFHSGECENWFVLNEEEQCIQHAVGNHNRWEESTASDDSEYEDSKRHGFVATYQKDLDSRVYVPDFSQDNSNFEKILANEELNEGQIENHANEAIQVWIAKGVRESAKHRDKNFGSEVIPEESSVLQTITKPQVIPEIIPATKTRCGDFSEEMSDLHIPPRRYAFKPIPETTPYSRPTLLSSTDERSDFGESSVQHAQGNYPQVILNREKIVTKRPDGGYFNAPRSAAQRITGPESERSEFGESDFAINSNPGRDSQSGFRGSRPGNRSMRGRDFIFYKF